MATSKTKTTAVTEVQQTAIAFSMETPDYIKRDSARGSEEVSANDMAIPRLEIVQALSPIKETNEDAREGLLFNSVTQEVLGDLVYFIPVYYRMEYLVWKDQDQGGGFFGSFPSESEANDRIAEAVRDGENADYLEVVDTPVHYGLLIDVNTHVTQQIVISMAKTKAKVSRKWNSMIQIVGGDRFSRVYKISTFRDENAKGQKFFNYVVQNAGFTPKAAYHEAECLYEVFKNEKVKVAHDSVVNNAADSASSERGEI